MKANVLCYEQEDYNAYADQLVKAYKCSSCSKRDYCTPERCMERTRYIYQHKEEIEDLARCRMACRIVEEAEKKRKVKLKKKPPMSPEEFEKRADLFADLFLCKYCHHRCNHKERCVTRVSFIFEHREAIEHGE